MDKQIKDTTRCAWKSFEGTYCPEVEQLLKRKEQELEQYKKSKQASYEALQKKCNELELENRKYKEANKDLLSIQYELAGNNKQLRQSLTEIKEIAESEMDSKEFMAVQCMLNGSVDNKNKVLKKILNKISEVIEDE